MQPHYTSTYCGCGCCGQDKLAI